jgi:ribonuclease G
VKKHIFLNCTPQETRVAILESSRLAELYIERSLDRGTVGNIYRGRVRRVLPGMQAAFVDIGFEKAAFLHASDTKELTELAEPTGDEAELVELEEIETDDNGELESEESTEPSPRRRQGNKRTPIENKLHSGEEIIVQVSKDPMGTKGARVTMFVSLAGRYLVFLPTTRQIGVSRRIEEEDERRRLRDLVSELRPPKGGFIVRTVCKGLSRKQIAADIAFLTREWSQIVEASGTKSAPALLHHDMDQVQRTIRDMFTQEVGRLIIDSPEEHERVQGLVEALAPRLRGRVELYEGPEPIFEHYKIEEQIDKALNRKVWLRSGGYLIIEQTEALIAIDVNTGRYVGKKDQEETILRTNLEAAGELVRQLRLRNLGGLIIIDFIDMESADNRRQVTTALVEEVRARDKTQTRILQISELGLVEMTRKRTRESLEKLLCSPCPHCDGTGRTKSSATVSYEILRHIRLAGARDDSASWIIVHASPAVTTFLQNGEQSTLNEMETAIGKKILIKVQETFATGHFEISTR